MTRASTASAVALLLLAGCAAETAPVTADPEPSAVAPDPVVDEPSEPQAGVDPARAIADYVEQHGRPGEHYELLTSFDAVKAAALTPPVVLDVQGGSGHGGSLRFLRFEVGAERTQVERVAYRAYAKPPSASVRRCSLPTDAVRPLLDAAAALPGVSVERRRKADAPLGISGGGTTNDFFVLVRAVDAQGAETFMREYAGYSGSRSEPEYLPIVAVQRLAAAAVRDAAWEEVPESGWRDTHFPETFRRNRDLMLRDFHWWVMERSVEALGSFGDRSCEETVRFLVDTYPNPLPRQQAKLRNVLENPETYLEGPPRAVRESD